jgi:hypothetical protein
MTAIVIRKNAKAAWVTGMAGVRTQARDLGRRAIAYAAAAVLAGAVGVALLQLVAEILSFPAPISVTAITLMAAALLTSLRRHLHPGRAPVWHGIRTAVQVSPPGRTASLCSAVDRE